MRSDEILKRTEDGVKESNRILLQELIYDLENQGISPVIGIDGEVKKLRLIHESELEDFTQIPFEKYDCKRSDFCVLEDDKTNWNDSGIFPIQGLVIVVHKETCKMGKYKAGNVSHWVVDFLHDLEKKFFVS